MFDSCRWPGDDAAGAPVDDAELFLRHPTAGETIEECFDEIAYLPRDCGKHSARLAPRWRGRSTGL